MAAVQQEGVYKDLLEIGWLKKLLKWRGLQFTLMATLLAFFLVILYAGLFGTPVGGANVGSTFTWLLWWPLIPVTMLVGAKVWCLMCPWIAPAEWLQRMSLWWKGKHTLSLNLKVPKFMRNFWMMLVLFLALHWTDANFHLAAKPDTTLYLALTLFTMAILVSLVFEKRSFCRYFCPVGAIISPYSLVAPLEIRNKDPEVCHACKTRDCVNGNEKGYGCPVMTHPYATDRNTYCLMCTECIKTCPNNNIALNVRRPFNDIFKKGVGFLKTKDVSFSLSFIVLFLIGIVPFHSMEMTNLYVSFENAAASSMGISDIIARTVAILAMGFIAVGLFSLFLLLSKKLAGPSEYNFKSLFIWFALPFIPVAIALHLGHNYFHLVEEGVVIIPDLSDPFGFGWNLFHTAGSSVTILSNGIITFVQFLTIGCGILASAYLLYRLPRNMFADKKQGFLTALPMLVFLVGIAGFYIWVLTVPMTMRF